MTVLRYKNRFSNEPGFNNLIGDLFPSGPSLFRDELKSGVPVNIRETETDFVLEIVAPGLNKEEFAINLENNTLTISAGKKTANVKENEKLIRTEYQFGSFKRSFTVDEKIAADKISAQYVNGVLTLNLPKKEEVKPAPKQITIQ